MSTPLAPLAVAVPLAGAAAAAIMGGRVPRAVRSLTALAAAAFACAACCILAADATTAGTAVHWFGGWTPRHGVALGIAFVADPAGGALAALAAFLTLAALLFAWTYYDREEGAFSALMLVLCASLIGFFLTGDLFNLFVFFELMSVSAYALTGFRSEDEGAVQGALAFGVVNSAGAFLVLAGIALVYARTGALNFAQIAHALAGTTDPLIVVSFTLIVVGFAVKSAIVPFHFWLSDAHAVAPTPVCVLFSGIMVEAGLYAIARCYWDVFSTALAPHADALRIIVLSLGVVTAVVGSVMAFAQRHLKRLLAFSTVAHSGLMLCGIALLNPMAVGGFVLYVLGHGLIKGSLFFGSGIVLNRYATLDVETLRGKLREVPWLSLVFAIGALGLAGLPPFGTFMGKALIDDAAAQLHADWAATILLVTSALTGGAVLNATGRMTFGWGSPPDPRAVTPGSEQPETEPARGIALAVMAVPTIALCALAVTIGALPALFATLAAAGRALTQQASHAQIILRMTSATPLIVTHVAPATSSFVSATAATLLAVAFAAASLFGYRVRPLWAHIARAYDRAMRLPHDLHSGIVTDDIAWLIVGSGIIGGVVLAAVR